MDPAEPQLGSRAAGARPRGQGPSLLFHVRPLRQPPTPRDLGPQCLSLKERIRLFEADVPVSQGPGPRAQGREGQEPEPSGRAWPPRGSEDGALSSRGPALSPSSARPPAQREVAEQVGETRPPPGAGPGCSVREQVRAFELCFGARQAPGAAAAPWGRGGQTGAPAAAAGPQQSQEQESQPPEKGGQLSALSAGLCLPQLEPPAPEQPQCGREGSSRALDLGALRAGTRALGLPQTPADACSPRLGQAARPQGAQGEGAGGEGPSRSPLLTHGPLMSGPLPADSRAPEPPPALPSAPWGLGESDGVDSDSTETSPSAPSEQSQPDARSFALSLAEAREFGQDRKEAPLAKGRSGSLSSSRSMASLIPAHDLEQLLEEESLQPRCSCSDKNEGSLPGSAEVRGPAAPRSQQHLEEIQVAVLHKDRVGDWVGGNDQHQRVTIHHAFASGLATQEATIQPRDEVLSIHGHLLTGCSHGEAPQVLHGARPGQQGLVVLRKGAANRVPEGSLPAPRPRSPPSAPDKPVTVMSVQLVKDTHGLGFSLAGGRGSLQGDRPLTVKKIFLGGPAELLQPGDELLRIQDKRLQGLARLEAWNLIRALPMGPVRLLVRKRGKP